MSTNAQSSALDDIPTVRPTKTLLDLFADPWTESPISDILLPLLPTETLINISRSHPALCKYFSSIERRVFNIDACLRPFLTRPREFRRMMLDTGAVVSGSFAVQFFLRTRYEDGDLDVYVGPDMKEEGTLAWTSAQKVMDHVTDVEGYEWCSDTNSYMGMKDIKIVSTTYLAHSTQNM